MIYNVENDPGYFKHFADAIRFADVISKNPNIESATAGIDIDDLGLWCVRYKRKGQSHFSDCYGLQDFNWQSEFHSEKPHDPIQSN